jgi:hypothetical protein
MPNEGTGNTDSSTPNPDTSRDMSNG